MTKQAEVRFKWSDVENGDAKKATSYKKKLATNIFYLRKQGK